MASSSAFLLGVDYSEWFPNNGGASMATDSSGALYFLSSCQGTFASCVTKISADGKTMLWQNQLGFAVNTMAVDPTGGVYVMPAGGTTGTSTYAAKLSAGGSGLAWTVPVGQLLQSWPYALAADSQGRLSIAGECAADYSQTCVVRLNAAGTAIDYTRILAGSPTSIAVDSSGAAFIGGYATIQGVATGYLARLDPGGSAGFYARLPQEIGPAVAVDANGNVALFANGLLDRVDAAGAVSVSTAVAGADRAAFALDAAGTAYITGATTQLRPVKNSLGTCGWDSDTSPAPTPETANWLSVIAPDGSLLQTTYIPGGGGTVAANAVVPLIATGPNSTVYVLATAGASFAPTHASPLLQTGNGAGALFRLSPNANAQTFPLACVGDAASFNTGPISPGEIVTLFGNGLGPQQGVQTQATLQSPCPAKAGNVEVTFDGTPAPLLWVQDAQINAVVPWSVTPGRNTQICFTYNNVKTNCLTWPVVETAPAVFTVDGVHAAAVNQDGTPNSADNPAPVGSIVSIWATGLGPITPAQPDGTLVGLPLPGNVLPVGVVNEWATPGLWPCGCGGGSGSDPLVVTYAGPAPYMVAGASQINFQVPHYRVGTFGALYLTLPSAQSPGFQIYVAGQ
jgi:uncharacterized protein (TIGR03437 family)